MTSASSRLQFETVFLAPTTLDFALRSSPDQHFKLPIIYPRHRLFQESLVRCPANPLSISAIIQANKLSSHNEVMPSIVLHPRTDLVMGHLQGPDNLSPYPWSLKNTFDLVLVLCGVLTAIHLICIFISWARKKAARWRAARQPQENIELADATQLDQLNMRHATPIADPVGSPFGAWPRRLWEFVPSTRA